MVPTVLPDFTGRKDRGEDAPHLTHKGLILSIHCCSFPTDRFGIMSTNSAENAHFCVCHRWPEPPDRADDHRWVLFVSVCVLTVPPDLACHLELCRVPCVTPIRAPHGACFLDRESSSERLQMWVKAWLVGYLLMALTPFRHNPG